MEKIRTATIALLLLLTLVGSLPAVSTVRAYDYGFGHSSDLYSTQWWMRYQDLIQIYYAFPQIQNLFAERYYWIWTPYGWWPYRQVYGHVEDFQAQTSYSLVTTQIRHCEQNHDSAAVFYYGHMGMRGVQGLSFPDWSYGFREQAQPNDPPETVDVIWDTDIYNAWNINKHHFVFLWVCHNGNNQGAQYPLPPHGMPFCWTRRSLSTNGYGAPDGSGYCFMSFQNASACLSEWMGTYGQQGTENIYKFWLIYFYYFALGDPLDLYYPQQQLSIKDSLDEASIRVGYDGWQDPNNRLSNIYDWWEYYWPGWPGYPEPPADDYWGKLRIYGDGHMFLPGDAEW